MKRFLIVKTSSIGDVIQCFHLIPYLKKRFPDAQIDWVVETRVAPLLRAHPDLTRVIEIDTRLWRKDFFKHRKSIAVIRRVLRLEKYDALFDLQGNTKSALITAFAKSEKKVGFSWKNLSEKTNFFATNVHLKTKEKISVREMYSRLLLDFFGDKEISEISEVKLKLKPDEQCQFDRIGQLGFQSPRIMVCFGSNWTNKQLTDKTLEELLGLIQEKYSPTFLFIWGNEQEKERADRFERKFSGASHTVGGMSLPLWQRVIASVDAVITIDSAALHLCATTKTPSFSLFGPTSSTIYKPLSTKHYAYQGKCPYGVVFEKRCTHLRSCHSGACLRDAQVNQIFRQFEIFWNSISQHLLVGNFSDSEDSR